MEARQRRCVFGDELKIQGSEEYTYSACMRQCRINRCKHKCNCVPHFYPVVKGDKMCTIKDLQCIYQNANFIKNVLHCNCELGCTNKVYELEKLGEAANTNHSNNKDVQINVRSDISLNLQFLTWPMVQYKREVLFGWVDLLVSFGGIAGLFLGFSLLSGVEIIYYFTMRACCMLYRNKEELYEVETKSKMERVTYNLSLKTSLNMNNKVNPMIGVHNRPDGVPNYRGTMMVRPQMYQ